jgi:hypothetical protein
MECPECCGTGLEECHVCGGEVNCETCDGTGEIEDEETDNG